MPLGADEEAAGAPPDLWRRPEPSNCPGPASQLRTVAWGRHGY